MKITDYTFFFYLHLKKKLCIYESVTLNIILFKHHTTTQAQWIGTVPIGYADGWHQQFKTTGVLIDGKRVPIVGRIAMDQLLVGLPEYYPVGTLVTFIGRQGIDTITVDEISRNAKQPEAEVLTSLSSRLPRIYMQDGSIKAIRNSLLDSLN